MVIVAVPEKEERMDAEVVSNKSSIDFTMVGGSAVSGEGMNYNKCIYYFTVVYPKVHYILLVVLIIFTFIGNTDIFE